MEQQKRKPGRPRKDVDLYRVKQKRVMHIKGTHGINEAWAVGDDIIRLDHPVLLKYAEGQFHKMEKLEGLPKGCTVRENIPQRIQREIEAHDRRQDTGSGMSTMPAVGRPSKELEDKVTTLTKENEDLRERLSALEVTMSVKATEVK